jgi:malate synthase
MEALGVLEQKISELVALVQRLRQENAQLIKDRLALQQQIDELQEASLAQGKELSHEKEFAKVLIDSLIKDIDTVVTQEHMES